MILRFMGEDVSAAEAVRRLHEHQSFHIDASLKLPNSVDDYFEWAKRSRAVDDMITAATDGPNICLLYTSPSPRDGLLSRMPSSA